jgi:hypothetical protein
LVFAVKQAYDLVRGVADFHLLNFSNFQRYSYRRPRPILAMLAHSGHPTWGPTPEICLPFVGDREKWETLRANALAERRNFDDYLLSRTCVRPLGPGIVYELGVYLAVHLGVCRLITVGWDIGNLGDAHVDHFYEERAARTTPRPVGRLLFRLRGVLRPRRYRQLESLAAHLSGRVYNRMRPFPDEIKLTSACTRDVYLWLKGKGVDLNVISDSPLIDPCIPRTSLNE